MSKHHRFPTHHRSSLVTRAAVVAGSAAAAAVVGLFPSSPAVASPAVAAPAAPVTVSVPVAPVAQIAPAAAPAPLPAAAVPAAIRASALSSAMSKIGAPYRWGATGPNAFDCSGLVSWAFKKAGVSLPRTSREMSKVGTPVAKSDLRPGDLVFFYQPVSHVAIYIGDGKVVHASNSKSPVKISDLSRMKFNSARRI